jgi:hypothetical protein
LARIVSNCAGAKAADESDELADVGPGDVGDSAAVVGVVTLVDAAGAVGAPPDAGLDVELHAASPVTNDAATAAVAISERMSIPSQ